MIRWCGAPHGAAAMRRSILLACVTAASLTTGCRFVDDLLGHHQTGLTRKWFAPVPIPGDLSLFSGMPAVAGGLVIVAVPGGLVAVDAETGQQRWRTSVSNLNWSSAASISVRDTTACLVDPSGVGCVGLSTGQLLWKELNDSATGGGTSAADATTLYYGRRHTVVARSLADGHVIWSSDIAPNAPFHAGPVGLSLRGDTVYVTAIRWLDPDRHGLVGDLVALDAHDGHILWTYTAQPPPGHPRAELWAPAVLAGSLAIIGELDGAWLIGVDVRTGAEVWRTPSDTTGYVRTQTPPTVVSDTVYSGSTDTQFYAIDAHTGRILWRIPLSFSLWSASLCGREAVVVPSGGGNLYTVDRATHTATKQFITESGDDAGSQVAVSGGIGYVMSMRGGYAFDCH